MDKKTKNSVIHFFAVYFILVFLSYVISPFIVNIILFGVLIYFFATKKNIAFLFALIYCLVDSPGGFFSQLDPNHRLPTLPLQAINYGELFLITAIIKTFPPKKINQKIYINTSLKILALLLVILAFVTTYYGVTINKFLYTIRYLLPFAFLFVIPRLFKFEQDYKIFFYLIFSFIFFVILNQVIQIIIGLKPAYLLGGQEIFIKADIVKDVDYQESLEKAALRPVYSSGIWILSLFGSMFYIYKNKLEGIKDNLPYIAFYGTLFSIFISGTRGWIIASGILLVLFLFITNKNPLGLFKNLGLPFLFVLIIFTSIPRLNKQLLQILDRFEIVEQLITNEVQGETNVARIDERAPKVMAKFKESPILGFGFSNEYYEYRDPHVANQTILLNSGIIGFSFFVLAFTIIILKLFKHSIIQKINAYRKIHLLSLSFLLFLLIIHSTSAMIFSFSTNVITGFALSLFFVFSNRIYHQYNLRR